MSFCQAAPSTSLREPFVIDVHKNEDAKFNIIHRMVHGAELHGDGVYNFLLGFQYYGTQYNIHAIETTAKCFECRPCPLSTTTTGGLLPRRRDWIHNNIHGHDSYGPTSSSSTAGMILWDSGTWISKCHQDISQKM